MEDAIISDVVYEKIKKFDHRSLDKRQYMLIDKLITNEELKKRYKSYGLCEGCKQPNTSHYGLQYWCQPSATGLAPYSDMAHENFLAVKICEGLRPSSNYVIPQLILDLIQRCWDADPSKRPDAENLCNSLKYLNDSYFGDFNSLICKQTHEASDINEGLLDSSTNYLSNDTHPKAIYTSRLLKKIEADYSGKFYFK
ncbi:11141_t:CDS:2 [Funneliformis caledonium]|uniref:11141_t:CDS:1 n=1 Tax=Funneliformis caledonium TaxID=1117310 RepID=A0A9N8VMC4_9GLOM|nr:11141_t:CDS:2 [Funneliformis caledonium]